MNLWTVVITAITAIGGPAVVLKIVGDRLLERQKAHYSAEMAERQNAFSMGANSHMATVVFDKYVGFCEEYVAAMSTALPTLIQAGATQTSSAFVGIRQKWALWLTDDIEGKLDRFEQLIPKIPSEAPVLDARGEHVSSIESRVKSVISDLRKVLATEELTTLRGYLVARSSQTPADVSR